MRKNEYSELITIMKNRYEKNMTRHTEIEWNAVLERLLANPEKLFVINELERTGGEPDVIGYDKKSDEYIFCDCSPESPSGRRSICYDRKAWDLRKENKPSGNSIEMGQAMGIEILTEQEYRQLQTLGEFDKKTSSWIKIPDAIRDLGGALFCDRRYNQVFVYHNGAESYYAARGFSGSIRV